MAFTRKVIAGLVTIVTVVLGLSLAVAGPAAAATGSWKPYGNTNPITSSASEWECASTVKIATNLVAQVCIIRSPSGSSIQGAVIVRNNGSSLTRAVASVTVGPAAGGADLGDWYCSPSGVAANSWSVCYGDTFVYGDLAFAGGYGNGTHLGWTTNN